MTTGELIDERFLTIFICWGEDMQRASQPSRGGCPSSSPSGTPNTKLGTAEGGPGGIHYCEVRSERGPGQCSTMLYKLSPLRVRVRGWQREPQKQEGSESSAEYC